jgi:hypothetical protein
MISDDDVKILWWLESKMYQSHIEFYGEWRTDLFFVMIIRSDAFSVPASMKDIAWGI